MTRAYLKQFGKMTDAREDLNRSMIEGGIESRHSIKSLDWMGIMSHDFGIKLRMHSFTVDCNTFSNDEKFAVVVPVTSVEVTCSEAMLALSYSTLFVVSVEKTGKISTRVNGWQYFRLITTSEFINYLEQFFTG